MAYSIAFSQATEIMVYIGVKTEEKQYKYLTLQTVSEKLNIPLPSVKRIIGLLKNEGYLISKTGSSGGVMLSSSLENITLFDIFKVIEGSKAMFKIHNDFDATKFEHAKLVETVLASLEEELTDAENMMLESLKNKTLKDLTLNKR